jgi:small subunit ribosomal protein S17
MLKEMVGTVTSDKMAKTRVIRVDRLVQHPLYRKTMKLRSKFYAHDEKNASKVGDKVRIEACRPLSRLKRWKVAEIIK